MKNKKQTFLEGTLVLIFSGIIIKILGFANKMILVRIIGEEGVGIYAMAYPTLLLVVTLTQLGLPVAISKLVAEADALGDRRKIKRILVVSFATTGILSLIFTVSLIILGPWLGRHVFTDPRTVYPLMAIAPIVPIVAIASVLRGYFQGLSNMRPYAYSQIIEQTVRISLVIVLAGALLPYGIEYGACGAMIAGVIGEGISLCYMFFMFKLKKRVHVRAHFFRYLKTGLPTLHELMRVALPSTGSRLIGSISYFLEPIVVARSLAVAGITAAYATELYGEVSAMAIPLLFLPSFITHALSVSLIPAISEASAKGDRKAIHARLHQALKLAMIAGGLSVIILFVFAYPLMDLLYNAPEAGVYVKLMAPFSFLFYFQGPLQATLQALDYARAAMVNSLIGAAVKLTAIAMLASLPELNIMGFALAFAINVVLVTLLHFMTVVKAIGFTVMTTDYLKSFLCIATTGLTAFLLQQEAFLEISFPFRTVLLIAIISMMYVSLTIFSGLIHREEIARLPFLSKWIKT